MTPNQFNDTLRHLDLSQVGAAKLLGYSDRTVRFWAAGRYRVPAVVSTALNQLRRGSITIKDLRRLRKTPDERDQQLLNLVSKRRKQ